MRARSVELFATAEEQLGWLREIAIDGDLWCLLERPRISASAFVRPSEMTLEMLGNQFSRARLFLGRTEHLSAPIWRSQTAPEELDFVKSQAVLLEPSIQTRREIIAGRIAIMDHLSYEEIDVNDEGLLAWYRSLVRSLKRMIGGPKVQLHLVGPGSDRAPARGNFLVSREAQAAWRSGVALKQFQEGNLRFELE